jgi:hypothetical protein
VVRAQREGEAVKSKSTLIAEQGDIVVRRRFAWWPTYVRETLHGEANAVGRLIWLERYVVTLKCVRGSWFDLVWQVHTKALGCTADCIACRMNREQVQRRMPQGVVERVIPKGAQE